MSERLIMSDELFKRNVLMARMLFIAAIKASESKRLSGEKLYFENNFNGPKNRVDGGWIYDVEFRINGIEVPFEESMQHILNEYNNDVLKAAESLILNMLRNHGDCLTSSLKIANSTE